MDKIAETFVQQAPTVFVLLWIFSQLRTDVNAFMLIMVRLLEKCMDDTDNDGKNGNNGSD